MSSSAVYETQTREEHIARDINSDFQFIADRLPTEVKESYPGEVFTLCSIEGIGVLWAKYAGQRPDRTGEAIMQYVVRIGMLADGINTPLELAKDFGLTYQTLRQEGQLTDLQPIHGEDLASCPVSPSVLEFSMRSLREEFVRIRGIPLEHTDDVLHLDAFRVA